MGLKSRIRRLDYNQSLVRLLSYSRLITAYRCLLQKEIHRPFVCFAVSSSFVYMGLLKRERNGYMQMIFEGN